MYGLIGRMKAVSGKRAELIAAMLEGMEEMAGCMSYVIAEDPLDDDSIWITEVWDSQESHKASLQLPGVRDTIAKARPLISGFDSHYETRPIGGHGLLGPGA